LATLFILIKTVVNFTVKKVKFRHEQLVRSLLEVSNHIETKVDQTMRDGFDKFPVKIGDKVIFIELDMISYIEAKDNYVYIHDMDGNEYLIDFTLKTIEPKMPDHFIRIHRSIIVNTNGIKEIHKYFNGKYAFILSDKNNSKVISSLSYTNRVKELFSI